MGLNGMLEKIMDTIELDFGGAARKNNWPGKIAEGQACRRTGLRH